MIQPRLHLFLVRHGKSEANQPWLFLGHLDSPLCPRGWEQAEILAGQLAANQFNMIYTSPLSRAVQTAQRVSSQQVVHPVLDPRLIEQDYGAWEGLTLDEVKIQFPEDVALWRTNALYFGPTQGERLQAVFNRAKEFCEEVLTPAQGKALVVAHGSVLNALVCYLLKTPLDWLWTYPFDYGNGGEVVLYEKRASLLKFNSLV